MLKSSKRFVMSDESLNRDGFVLRTAGANIELFKKNPILLYNHTRGSYNGTDSILPLGYWEDIQVEGTTITGVPVFDETDPFAKKIYDKVENGTLRMTSAAVYPLAISERPEDMVQGQKYPTVTEWEMWECSIVDVGSNRNAIALYYKSPEGEIHLAANGMPDVLKSLKIKNSNIMEGQTLDLNKTAGQLGLAADKATPENVAAKIAELVGKSQEAVNLKAENDQLKTENQRLVTEAQTAKVNALVDGAIADGRITTAQKESYAKLAAADYDSTKGVLEAMPKHTSAAQTLSAGGNAPDANDPLLKLSYDEAFQNGKLGDIKEKYPDYFKEIFKQKFNKEPK